jgi:hypothetical protein
MEGICALLSRGGMMEMRKKNGHDE